MRMTVVGEPPWAPLVGWGDSFAFNMWIHTTDFCRRKLDSSRGLICIEVNSKILGKLQIL